MKQNYQLMLDRIIESSCANGKRPRLLLHACCAPCSSYVLEYLSRHFEITLFFYNPNISPQSEYDFRAKELLRLVDELGLSESVSVLYGNYDPHRFFEMAKGMEHLPEGGERCRKCYALRLSESARIAADGSFDFYTTTLSISPHKNAEWLNELGVEMGDRYGVSWLYSDFKKKNGYKRSCELSVQLGLYRQSYCGCVYSKREEKQGEANENE